MAAVLDEVRPQKLDHPVVIIGRRSMQNKLVAELIDERIGCPCEVRSMWEDGPVERAELALLDVQGMSVKDAERYARAAIASGSYRSIALMNAEEASVQRFAYLPAVRGVFFGDTSPEHLLKGLRAMLNGEYWLPRSVLAAHFERTRPNVAFAAPSVALTRKEAETLKLLVGGNSNNGIARRLGVSPHTVKTHLYNLFRKIGVRNRVQAAKWAMETLADD